MRDGKTEFIDKNLGRLSALKDRAIRCDFCSFILANVKLYELESSDPRCEIWNDRLVNLEEKDRTNSNQSILSVKVTLRFDGKESKKDSQILEMQYYHSVACGSGQPLTSLARRVQNEVSLEVIGGWPRCCSSYHRECGQAIAESQSSSTIDLQVIDVQELCLIDATARERYIALSYIWGNTTAQVNRALSSTSDLFLPNSLRGLDLPQTILDAIDLVREIGERYVWIDAVCIPKNDIKARALQIAQMASIYTNAFFTIVAACGGDANAGLVGFREGTRRSKQQKFRLGSRSTLLEVISGSSVMQAQKSKWQTRAWTLQEGVLSRRQLFWTETQVHWACDGAVWFEELDLEGYDANHLTPVALFMPRIRGESNSMNCYDPDTLGDDLKTGSSGALSRWARKYKELRHNFFMRNLSRSEDMLNAFTGLMNALSIVHPTCFVFGMPEMIFTEALLWSMPGRPRNHSSMTLLSANSLYSHAVPFPSWSWSAWLTPLPAESFKWLDTVAVLPVLKFYRLSTDGRCAQIMELPAESERYNASDCLREQEWRLQPRRLDPVELVEPDSDWVDSGLLKCWTSTSTVYLISFAHFDSLKRKRKNYEKCADNDVELESIEYESALTTKELLAVGEAHVFHTSFNPRLPQIFHSEFDVVKKEIMVIARGDPSAFPSKLMCMIFDRINGIAYRVGLAWTEEDNWIAMERKWELITLG